MLCVFTPIAGEATVTCQMRWARDLRDSKDSKGLDREKGPQAQFIEDTDGNRPLGKWQ